MVLDQEERFLRPSTIGVTKGLTRQKLHGRNNNKKVKGKTLCLRSHQIREYVMKGCHT